MKFELNETEKKWINNLINNNQKLLLRLLSTDKDVYYNTDNLNYDLKECFENHKIEKFLKKSKLILNCYVKVLV